MVTGHRSPVLIGVDGVSSLSGSPSLGPIYGQSEPVQIENHHLILPIFLTGDADADGGGQMTIIHIHAGLTDDDHPG